jgi:histidinol-phosphatase (PHP family)
VAEKTGLKNDWCLPEDRLEPYLEAVREARRRWEGRLRIYLGLEADYIGGLTGPADKEYRDLGLDYLIGSVHYLVPPRSAPFTVDGSREELDRGLAEGFGGDGEALMHCYWDQVAAMIRAGGFDILGHADLIKKNNRPGGREFFDPRGPGCLGRMGEIALLAGKAARSGMVAELNTGGMNRGKVDETYPSPSMLRLFREQGVPALITADAHRARDLDGHYGEALETMRRAGYSSTVLFEGREGGRPRWIEREIPGA